MASALRAPFSDPWRPDYQLLRDSPINRFADLSDLEGVKERLGQLGYHVVTTDASSGDRTDVLSQVNDQVPEWPGGYGTTLDGFNDALRDFEGPAVAFTFSHFDYLRASDALAASAMLDSLVAAAWFHVLEGRLFIALVHSAEPLDAVGTFGATQWRGWWIKADA